MDWHLKRTAFLNVSGFVMNPPDEPVDRLRAKQHLKGEDTSADDDSIDEWRVTVREACEQHTNRALVRSRWTLHQSSFPWGTTPMTIPLGGVAAIESVTYRDPAGVVVPYTTYELVVRNATRSRIEPAFNTRWPVGSHVVVTFNAGADGATQRHISGMLLMIGYLSEHRGDTDAELPPAVAALWDSPVY